MARKEPTPFERIFPRGDLLRGRARWSCFWAVCASLLMVLLLVDLYLLSHLLIHAGRFELPAADNARLEALIAPRGAEVAAGLLPVVWAERDRPWGPWVATLYRRAPYFQNDRDALAVLVTLAALFSLMRAFCESRARTLALQTALNVATRLRQAIHRQSLRLGPSDLEGKEITEVLHLFTAEVDQIRDGLFAHISRLGRDVPRLLLLVTLAFAVHPVLALQCVVPLAACWYIARQETLRLEAARRLSEALSAKELRLLAEGLLKTRLVRGYGMEAFERDQFQKYLDRFQEMVSAMLRAKVWSQRGVRVLVAACLALVLYLVSGRIVLPPHDISFPAGLLLLLTLTAAYFPLQGLSRLQADREAAELSSSRVQAYLNKIPEVGQAVGAKFLQPLSKMLEFEKVSYTLGKRNLLDGLNLRIKAGRQVALVATDPLESLALAYMLPRFVEPQSGRILIDGEDISWVTLESLRAETIFVGGKDPFLTGTVRDNIAGGNTNYSPQEVTEAAKVTHAHNFILKLPQGYETVVGEHGEQLDAGQGFRLGLARALLRKPALLIIEEPSEALDDDTKSLLDDAYTRIAQKRTVLFLPRRMATLRRADEIVFIHHGRVVSIGAHDRIVQTSQLYRHWEYINFNEFRHEFEAEA